MKQITMVIITSLLTTACSSVSYQEPTTGKLARVRFVADSTSVSVLRVYDDQGCSTGENEWLRLRNGYLVNSTTKKLGMPLWNYNVNAAKEVYVQANKELNGLFIGAENDSTTIYECGTPFSFNFSENTDYEVLFKWYPKECKVTVSQIISNSNGYELRELSTFTNKATEKNKGCLNAFKKQRLY